MADTLSHRRTGALYEALEKVRSACDVQARLVNDPVRVVRRYERVDDREIVALMAACLAFGQVRVVLAKLDDALLRLGPRPAELADSRADLESRLAGWKHRTVRSEHLVGLLLGARSLQREHGALGGFFSATMHATGNLRATLTRFVQEIRERGALPARVHLLADPEKGSGCKRLQLMLRWMCRKDDGVDLGMWDVPTSALLFPVDVHIHRLARNLGLTERRDLSWRTAEEITSRMGAYDAVDPVKYDFSLCHLGMLRRCPSRKDEAQCSGCGIKSVCIHWAPENSCASSRGRRKVMSA